MGAVAPLACDQAIEEMCLCTAVNKQPQKINPAFNDDCSSYLTSTDEFCKPTKAAAMTYFKVPLRYYEELLVACFKVPASCWGEVVVVYLKFPPKHGKGSGRAPFQYSDHALERK
jgi:hypothetical protein